MPLTVEAIYENGVLKPARPLPQKEHERVQVTVGTPPLDILRAGGILGWKGTSEELAPFALHPEFEYPPGAGGAMTFFDLAADDAVFLDASTFFTTLPRTPVEQLVRPVAPAYAEPRDHRRMARRQGRCRTEVGASG